jgi:hypothetical protein
MAVASWSSSAALVKAVVLPLILVLLVVSAGASSAEDGPAVAKSGGRFSETPVGRKLLNINLCGSGSAPDYKCKTLLPLANNATCCTDEFGTQSCWDVGAFWVDKCGSCTTKCLVGEFCCSGVCANLQTDKNNCGVCGNKCGGSVTCKFSSCGY